MGKLPLSRRILIVDDERDVGITLKLILENNGFIVDCFNDPTLALDSFKPDLYDLLILDIKMPKINGFELYNHFKSKDTKLKTLFLTAISDLTVYDDQRTKVYPKMGERHFLQKPIANNELMEQVYSILN
jgi:two-component system response regulator ChvI